MKKKHISLVIIGILILLAVSVTVMASQTKFSDYSEWFDFIRSNRDEENDSVVLVVNGQEITQSSIDQMVMLKKLMLQMQGSYASSVEMNDDKSLEKQVIDNKIRSIVILDEAKRQGLEADYAQAYKEGVEAYELVKGTEQYAMLEEYMDAFGLTEEEYLKLNGEVYQNMYTSANLKTAFEEVAAASENSEKDFEEYVTELIKQANIEYK